MPLIKSMKKEAVGKNIEKEMAAGKPHKQAIAIALNVQRQARKKKMASGGFVKGAEATNEPSVPARKPDDMRPPMDDIMSNKMTGRLAHGGMIPERAKSIADAILMKRKKMAAGGFVDELEDDHRMGADESLHDESEDSLEVRHLADGGMVELNNEEEPYAEGYDRDNEAAIKKELYDDEQLSADPMDSNEHGDDLADEDEHAEDMISRIRKRMRSRTE